MSGSLARLFTTKEVPGGKLDMEYVGPLKWLNKLDRQTGLSPLHIAAQWTSAARIQEMIAKGAIVDICAAESAGRIAPLFSAAHYCNLDALDALLLAGADITARDSDNWTPLMYAMHPSENHQHRMECVLKLVTAGVPLNAQNAAGATALQFAAEEKSPELVAFLLECGVDQNLALHDGWTPLYTACTKKDYPVLELLLACPGTNPNVQTKAQKATALHHAAFQNDLEMIYMLLAAGADPCIENAPGALPYQCARAAGHSLAATILMFAAKQMVADFDEMVVMQEDGSHTLLSDEIRQRAERLALARQKLLNAKNDRIVRLLAPCTVCQEATAKSCGKCRKAFYCSAACQRSDWSVHKQKCNKTNGTGNEN